MNESAPKATPTLSQSQGDGMNGDGAGSVWFNRVSPSVTVGETVGEADAPERPTYLAASLAAAERVS